MVWDTRSEEAIELDRQKGKKIVKEKIIIQDKKGRFIRANITEWDKDMGAVDREVYVYDIKTDRRRVLKKIKDFIKFKPRVKFIETSDSITIKYDESILDDEQI